jgi:hypothetical protein
MSVEGRRTESSIPSKMHCPIAFTEAEYRLMLIHQRKANLRAEAETREEGADWGKGKKMDEKEGGGTTSMIDGIDHSSKDNRSQLSHLNGTNAKTNDCAPHFFILVL